MSYRNSTESPKPYGSFSRNVIQISDPEPKLLWRAFHVGARSRLDKSVRAYP